MLLSEYNKNPIWRLSYLYPLLMPLFSMRGGRVPIHSLQDALTYYLFTGTLQLILLLLIRRILCSDNYNQWIRRGMALAVGGLVLFVYLFLEFNVFHFTERIAYSHKGQPVPRYIFNVFIIVALVEGIKSVVEREKIVLGNIMLENENAKAQLNLLLQQINPHFLFNCLSVLQSMTRSNDARTETFIVKLEEVYRQTLKTDKGVVSLREEIKLFDDYMYLMRLRQENAIFVEINVSEEALSQYLPVFSLQLLAENCIKHNIVSSSKPLTIRLYQKEAKSLTISNNIQPKVQKNESFGIGIENLKKRYALEGISKGVQIENNQITYSTTLKLLTK